MVESENLQKTSMPLDVFEFKLRSLFGLGTSKTVNRWISNFNDAGLIKVTKDRNSNDVWVVEVL